MNIYAYKNPDHAVHITDLFDSIDTIIFVDDIRHYHPDMVNSSEDMDYLDMPESDLRNVPQHALNHITDIKVLEYLHKTAPDLMTDTQKNNVTNLYRTKIIISEQDVECIISRLHDCTLTYSPPLTRGKNLLDDSKKLKIVQRLQPSDYVDNQIEGYSGNDLAVFITKQTLKSESGPIHKTFLVCVKIDTTQTIDSGSTVAVVSLHDTASEESHP